MKQTLFRLFIAGFLLIQGNACIPPRCKIQNCEVVIDHNHRKYKEAGAEGKSAFQVYRGLPWYRYIFRKKYKAKSANGRYRKIDTREAYDKK